MGQGEGCTATGTGLNAMTENHGPVKTSNGIPTATGTAAAKMGQIVEEVVWEVVSGLGE